MLQTIPLESTTPLPLLRLFSNICFQGPTSVHPKKFVKNFLSRILGRPFLRRQTVTDSNLTILVLEQSLNVLYLKNSLRYNSIHFIPLIIP